jgi:signal transduction histidine kinase
MGRMVHAHRMHAAGQQNRAEQLERDQDARAVRAIAAERARIARELHDVIAHSLSVIVVQAAAERRVLATGQESTGEVLESIEQCGRQAMTELRRLLGLLRKSDGEPSLAPQPGLSRLADLVAQVREAGVDIAVHTDGDLAGIPRGLDLSAYRIVQECLTNVLKHASARRVEVTLRCQGRFVDIDVTDDGTSAMPSVPSGFGLLGMRERVTVYGGTVQAGPVQVAATGSTPGCPSRPARWRCNDDQGAHRRRPGTRRGRLPQGGGRRGRHRCRRRRR